MARRQHLAIVDVAPAAGTNGQPLCAPPMLYVLQRQPPRGAHVALEITRRFDLPGRRGAVRAGAGRRPGAGPARGDGYVVAAPGAAAPRRRAWRGCSAAVGGGATRAGAGGPPAPPDLTRRVLPCASCRLRG